MGERNLLRLRLDAAPGSGGVVTVTGAELHHLRVRRLTAGDAVTCFDDSGAEYTGVVRHISADRAEIDIASVSRPERESPLRIVLAQAVLKGDHLDVVVEKTTELGVAEIVLFTCERSLARPSPARLARLGRIAASAAKQSGRTRVPEIQGPLALAEILSPGAVVLDPGSVAKLAWNRTDGAGVTAVVGPEGGFTPAEIERARAAGCRLAGLGPRVLRAETAAITAVALCQFLGGDLSG